MSVDWPVSPSNTVHSGSNWTLIVVLTLKLFLFNHPQAKNVVFSLEIREQLHKDAISVAPRKIREEVANPGISWYRRRLGN